MNKYETTVKGKHVSIDFEVAINKSAKVCFLCVKFETKESRLLNTILWKYIYEKCLGTGVNMNNHIYSAIYGANCIVLLIPENKITQNISLLYAYIAKIELDRKLQNRCGEGNYNTLEKDLKRFTVMISGKCKNFIAALKNNANKIDQMIDGIDMIDFKKRDSFKSDKEPEERSHTFIEASSPKTMMYLSIVLGSLACEIRKEGSKIRVQFNDYNDINEFKEMYQNSNVFRYRVKNFLTQSGNVGKPSANDKDGKKFKEKSKMIKDSQNMLARMFSNVRGFNYEFKDLEDLKSVDSEALTPILRHKFEKEILTS